MSKVFIEETTLTAIGNAIRAKTGKEDLIAPLDMADEIDSISGGGGEGGSSVPDSVFFITGDCSTKLANDTWDYFMENEPFKSQFRSENITKGYQMFYGCKNLTKIPFELNFSDTSAGVDIGYLFANCEKLKELPDLGGPLYVKSCANLFNNCIKIKEIPQSWVENFKNDVLLTSTNSLTNVFSGCQCLRNIPIELMSKMKTSDSTSAYYSSLYYTMFQYCRCMDEIRGIPIYGTFGSNVFVSAFNHTNRVSEITFETNEDGTPKTAKWKNQTIDLSSDSYPVGYAFSKSDILNISDDFKQSDMITTTNYTSAGEYEAAMAANPNWFSTDRALSRYTKQSAINTINSLPDTSAYLAANGGTNTIKFKGSMASARVNNGENLEIAKLTPEQIAVAAAKGWTVTLV